MNRRLARLRRIGGNCAVTRWSWILTAPFAVTVMGSYISARGVREWPAFFGAAILVHLVMGFALLLVWLTVLRPDRERAQPVVAVLTFAGLGACRPFVLDALLEVQGYEADPRSMVVRVLINVTTAVVALSLIALLVDSVREHKAMMQRLRGARQALDQQRRADEEYLAGLGRQCAEDLAEQIAAARSRTDPSDIDTERASRLLREISQDIVRPMSHALFEDVTPLPRSGVAPPAPTRREQLAAVLQAVQPAPLALPVLLYTVPVLVYLMTSYGLRETILQVVAGISICVSGNWLVRRWVTGIPGTAHRIVVMVLAYSAIAAATAVAFWVILGGRGFPPAFVVPGIAFYPFAALAMCLIQAATRQRALEEQELVTALGEQSRSAAEVHGRVLAARRRLAHVLHSSVQGELVAAALSLHAARAEPSAARPSVEQTVAELIDRILLEVARHEDAADARADARQQVTELIGTWASAVPIVTDIAEDVWPLLSASPVRLDNVIDVLSEGFTNAIRHGTGGTLRVTMSVDPRTSLICIAIRSPGRITGERSDGLGLTMLSSTVGAAELVEESGSVLLAVRLD